MRAAAAAAKRLTDEEGLERKDEVLTLIFQYLHMLRYYGPKQWIFEECKKIDWIDFKFQDKEEPIDYVSDLAGRLGQLPVEDVVTGWLLREDSFYFPLFNSRL